MTEQDAFDSLRDASPYEKNARERLDAFGRQVGGAVLRDSVAVLGKYLTSKTAVRLAGWVLRLSDALPQPHPDSMRRAIVAVHFVAECYRRRVNQRFRNDWIVEAHHNALRAIGEAPASESMADLIDEIHRTDLDGGCGCVKEPDKPPSQALRDELVACLHTTYALCIGRRWSHPSICVAEWGELDVWWAEPVPGCASIAVFYEDGRLQYVVCGAREVVESCPCDGEGDAEPAVLAEVLQWQIANNERAYPLWLAGRTDAN